VCAAAFRCAERRRLFDRPSRATTGHQAKKENVMKKTLRRLRLDRETVRNLTPGNLESVAGGIRTDETCHYSCDTSTRPISACNSCFTVETVCC
jgi:hypothetical protein